MINKSIYESGEGGQPLIQNNDIKLTRSLSTLVYYALFAGNVEGDTSKNTAPGELHTGWWGNDVTKNSINWINSETERLLKGISLSPRTRILIEQAVIKDTDKLKVYGRVDVNVTLPSLNRVSIRVTITEPEAATGKSLLVIWDATRNEVVEQIEL